MANNGPVSFFVGAHPDDWQIFAGNHARNDLWNCKARVVFVYLTAGDAGQSDGWWQAREEGAIASTVLLAKEKAKAEQSSRFNDPVVFSLSIGNTMSYFLRLPDDHLTSLREGESSLKSVDGSAEYPNWGYLVRTIGEILDFEAGDFLHNYPWVNTSEYMIDPFPGEQDYLDNPDHSATGDVVRMIVKGKYKALYWAGYDDTRRKDLVNDADFLFKQSLMIEYSKTVRSNYLKRGEYEEFKEFCDRWMRYTYTRTESPQRPS